MDTLQAFFFTDPTLPSVFIEAFVLGLSGAAMPGPVLARTFSHVPRHGFLAGPLMILGHMVLELIMVSALVFGLAAVINTPWAFRAISLVGGLVLLGFSISMFAGLPKLSLRIESGDEQGSGSRMGPVVDGILLSAANPYWWIWWATIGLSLVLLSRGLGPIGVVVFFCGHILSDYGWYALMGGLATVGKKRVPDRAYRWFIGGCAALLVYFAVSFIVGAFGEVPSP